MNYHRSQDYKDDEGIDEDDAYYGKWAMEVIERKLERAFEQAPKFSTLHRYLHHQCILVEAGVDEAGNAPDTVTEDCFPGNLDPPRTKSSLQGTISATFKKGQLYIMSTDSLNKRLNDQYRNQGRRVPVFRDERLKKKSYPKFVRDDISKQEMHLAFNQELV